MYFPVSALVTLFGNILQNPLDARAKSDARLMGLVVTFLSMLGQEAEQGGVHRMLGVCSEFVRIADVVIARAEKEQSSRRKRKTVDGKPVRANGKSNPSALDTSEVPIPTTLQELSPPLKGRPSSWGPVAASTPPPKSSPAATSQSGWSQQDYQQHQQQHQHMPQNGDFETFANLDEFVGVDDPATTMPMGAPFQQPLLPQDLFALPMTLDWNWAEMSGGAYPTVENGKFDDMNYQYHDQQ